MKMLVFFLAKCVRNAAKTMVVDRKNQKALALLYFEIFHQIRKFVLDFKDQSADSNESKSGQINLQRLLSETGILLSKARG